MQSLKANKAALSIVSVDRSRAAPIARYSASRLGLVSELGEPAEVRSSPEASNTDMPPGVGAGTGLWEMLKAALAESQLG
ncbi:hypothetical protein D3C81_1968210 [compost metagenome]